ncbi:RteC domain-containing protein [Sphingobacterium corticibacter]|uniref:Tetracycline regulation of excision, RteC n=1 Tax=Sphingobacterium corticibacter TaxID=2171749 RepID=A0A2T8HN68_9SPHI|nr:RteC domain-containing protein [Sphingobacterium corticibacter]PVH26888.1 tetracycline regulation of excision, RteC [Sphingobacterium corticibacter]
MNNFCKEVIQKLDEEIKELSFEEDNIILLSEAVVELILVRIKQIKQYVLEKGFKDIDEEINFFKKVKPSIVSKLIYYNAIYKIESKKPYGGDKALKKYLENEVTKLKRFFDNNLDFYRYYRTNSTYLDHKYFIRGKYDIKLSLDTYYFESDHSFATSHDYKAAKILANDLIQVYLEDQLFKKNINTSPKNYLIAPSPLSWTSSKTSLIELIYALHSQATFNNGLVDIKLIAKTFEEVFNIELGDFYRTYLELRNRKTNRTKFIDSLRDSLTRKMDEQDEE